MAGNSEADEEGEPNASDHDEPEKRQVAKVVVSKEEAKVVV